MPKLKYDDAEEQVSKKIRDFVGDDETVINFIDFVLDENDDDFVLDTKIDSTAHQGKIKFIEKNTDGEIIFESEILENPTWLQVCKVAHEIIKSTTDSKEAQFVEEINIVDKDNDISIAEIFLGT